MCGLRFPQPSNSNQLVTNVDQRIGTAVGTPVGFQAGSWLGPKNTPGPNVHIPNRN